MPPEKKLPFTEAELTQLCSAASDIMAKVDGDNVEMEALKRQVDALKINFLDGKFFFSVKKDLISRFWGRDFVSPFIMVNLFAFLTLS